jgi:hypothetical protein
VARAAFPGPIRGRSGLFEYELGGDGDRALEAPVHGAIVGVEAVYPLGRRSVHRIGLQPQLDVDALENQDLPVELNVSRRFADQEPFTGRNLTRLQRASEGPDQSTCGGRDRVVEGRCVRLVLPRLRSVVLGDRPVRPEPDWLGLGREPCPALRTLDPLDADLGTIGDVSHGILQRAKKNHRGRCTQARNGEDVQGKTQFARPTASGLPGTARSDADAARLATDARGSRE